VATPNTYRVCIIVQPGNPHSQCFMEVGLLVKNALLSLKVSCDIAVNDLAADRINILLGWHLLAGIEAVGSTRIIPYQLEQLSDAVWEGFSPERKTILERAFDVWDYSVENVEFLKGRGLRARLAPIGYHESLEQIPKDREKDIDVLFFGSAGERRKRVLNELAADSSIVVRALFGVYGTQRDEYISRSKIILNVHFYSTKIFEAVRISYLLNNTCCVVSETSEYYPYTGVDIPMFPYETLARQCRMLLRSGAEIDRVRQRAYLQFKDRYPMTECLRKVIST